MERRVSTASDPTEPLLVWARKEAEDFGDTSAAIALCERALELRPDAVVALELLAQLRLRSGAAEGALEALEAWRRHCSPSEHDRIDLNIAQLLFEQLDKGEQAFEKLEPLLRRSPLNEGAIAMTASLAQMGTAWGHAS